MGGGGGGGGIKSVILPHSLKGNSYMGHSISVQPPQNLVHM